MKKRMVPIWFDTLDSTNSEVLRHPGRYDNLSVVAARCQTAGRGQRGNRWLSEGGANLTFSLVLDFGAEGMRPLPAGDAFFLSRAASLGIRDFLGAEGVDALVKWPNDIYVRNRKICGMLIENTLKGERIDRSVIGIGLNLNQKDFPVEVTHPVSLAALTGRDYPLEDTLLKVCGYLEARLFECPSDHLEADYHSALYRLDTPAPYTDCRSGEHVEGIIRGVTRDGKLLLETLSGEQKQFSFKEISYII